jgi:O-antigen ligase
VAGGWAGVGYGISAGWETGDFQAGVTSVGYGREKGNSQLAIVEETGLVGLGLSLLVVVVVFRKLARGYRAAPSRDAKVLIGLVMGTLAGLLVQSVFEAWWDAPGSPEFVLFWVMTGVGLGVAQAVRARAASRSVAPTGLSPAPA